MKSLIGILCVILLSFATFIHSMSIKDVLVHIISIPVVHLATIVQVGTAFIVGYLLATIPSFFSKRKLRKDHAKKTDHLLLRIDTLKDELNRKIEVVYKKDRMNQELEQLALHKRAFSEDVLSKKLKEEEDISKINFDRIGTASLSSRNDLQKIAGIGSFTEIKLNELGIYTYDQISKFTDEDIELVTDLIKFFPGRIKKDRWIDKAKELIDTPKSRSKEEIRISNKLADNKTTE